MIGSQSFAQKRFDGPYQIQNVKGIATFNYVVQEGDTLKTGDFTFTNEQQTDLKPVRIKGQFKDNKPSGSWEYSYGEFVPLDRQELVGLSYVTKLDGFKKSINGNYENGLPEGSWIIAIDSVKNSEIAGNHYRSEITYENGVPQRSFRIDVPDQFMIGRLLRDGRAHDTWTLFSKDGISEDENWTFANGLLTELNIKTSDSKDKQFYFDYNETNKMVTIPLDRHYLDIMELRLQRRDTVHFFDHGLSTLLKQNSTYLHEIEGQMQDIGAAVKLATGTVKVPLYELTNKERKTLDRIAAIYDKSRDAAVSIRTNSQLNLARLTDQQTALLYNAIVTIDTTNLKTLGKLSRLHGEEVTQHILRKELINGLWPLGLPDTTIKTIDTANVQQVYRHNISSSYNRFDFALDDVEELARFSYEVIKEIQGQLNVKTTAIKRKPLYLSEEDKLVAESTVFKEMIDSLATIQREDIAKTLRAMQKNTEKQLTQYVKMPENDEKLNRAKQLTACINNKKLLINTLVNIPNRQEALKKKYTEDVYVIFTATFMEEQVKKRITKAYEDYLLPYLLQQVQDGLECGSYQEWIEQYETLNSKLTTLRDEDTQRLERRLKREEDPQEILKLLGV
ncbi:hypothetical protein BST86_14090 [Nonlabens agnitus]|uniref:Uncharacterized protein n=1 Tax=Nonlabens agnitus TaxID=870484 RepID=A0A2S9WXE2_9FLAO|nr:hypothetical protein BST86_14090 [Nonlabens agnitus]